MRDKALKDFTKAKKQWLTGIDEKGQPFDGGAAIHEKFGDKGKTNPRKNKKNT